VAFRSRSEADVRRYRLSGGRIGEPRAGVANVDHAALGRSRGRALRAAWPTLHQRPTLPLRYGTPTNQIGEAGDDEIEPPVPERVGELTASQAALAEFLRTNRDLLDVAATAALRGSATAADVAAWAEQLPSPEKEGFSSHCWNRRRRSAPAGRQHARPVVPARRIDR
jgi:hypothetical protein